MDIRWQDKISNVETQKRVKAVHTENGHKEELITLVRPHIYAAWLTTELQNKCSLVGLQTVAENEAEHTSDGKTVSKKILNSSKGEMTGSLL